MHGNGPRRIRSQESSFMRSRTKVLEEESSKNQEVLEQLDEKSKAVLVEDPPAYRPRVQNSSSQISTASATSRLKHDQG